MESHGRNLEDGDEGGHYVTLWNGDINAESDDSRLKQLGYKQELSRSLSAIANFSVTFSIVSIITGLTTTYSTGLTYGGPVTMVYGWPVVGVLTLIVGLAMAEICSAYPTSGGLYFWSAKLCGNHWAPLASWLTGWFEEELQDLDVAYALIGREVMDDVVVLEEMALIMAEFSDVFLDELPNGLPSLRDIQHQIDLEPW